MELPSFRAVIGFALVLAIAAGFEFALWWLFLAAMVVFFGWCGYMLFAEDES